MHKYVLHILIGGFVTGVLWRSFFDGGIALSMLLILLAGATGVYAYVSSYRMRGLLVTLGLCMMVLGVVRVEFAEQGQGDVYVDMLLGSEIVAEGIISDEPDTRESTTLLTVSLETVGEHAVDTKILIITNRFPEYSYGDRIRIEGEIIEPASFETDTGRTFDYKNWLAKGGIHYQMFRPVTKLLGSGEGSSIKATLFSVKQTLLANIESAIPDPEAALAGGLIVGEKQSLGEDLTNAFRATGVIHIVVLSGFNVTIIAEFIRWFFSWLPLRVGISVSAVSVILFAILAGADATIVRATIMGLLVMLARATGRTYAITRALFIAGFFMVLWNPLILVHDPAFQLSFLATIGLIHLAPRVEAYLKWIPNTWHIRDYAAATLATQLFVLPLLLYQIGELSLVATFANMAVLVAVPWAMLFGFLTGVFSLIHAVVAAPFAYISFALLHYQITIVEWFASVPLASVVVPAFPFFVVVCSYLILVVLTFRSGNRLG